MLCEYSEYGNLLYLDVVIDVLNYCIINIHYLQYQVLQGNEIQYFFQQ